MNERHRTNLLIGAVLVPIVYFGIQLLAAPFFPGYDFVRDVASLLGSDRAEHAAWFNGGAILSGICAIIGAAGLFVALQGASPNWLRVLLAIALALVGIGNIWAGLFPLPDPRHAANPLMPAFLAMPVLFGLAAWRAPGLRGLRPYLTINLLLFILMVPVMAGITGIDRGAYGGLLQRLLALTLFLPIGVVGWHLWRQKGMENGH